MSKKSLPTEEVIDDLADSPFFKKRELRKPVPQHHDTVIPRHRDTTTPLLEDDPIEAIRAALKHFGKESATQRLTLEEKQELREIEFSYLKQGIHTTGNEIIRIAINSLVLDYKKNGENSTLAKVLKKLNS